MTKHQFVAAQQKDSHRYCLALDELEHDGRAVARQIRLHLQQGWTLISLADVQPNGGSRSAWLGPEKQMHAVPATLAARAGRYDASAAAVKLDDGHC